MAEAIQPPERPRPESGSGEDEARRVAESSSLLVRWMSIGDANSGGFIHGGTVMRLVDEAAGLAAIKHSGRRVVTAGMDRMTFNTPVFVGELLRCTASVNAVWRRGIVHRNTAGQFLQRHLHSGDWWGNARRHSRRS